MLITLDNFNLAKKIEIIFLSIMTAPYITTDGRFEQCLEHLGDRLYNAVISKYIMNTYPIEQYTPNDLTILTKLYVGRKFQSKIYELINVKKYVDLPIRKDKNQGDHLEMYIGYLNHVKNHTFEDIYGMLHPCIDGEDIEKYHEHTKYELNIALSKKYRCVPSYIFTDGTLTIKCNNTIVYQRHCHSTRKEAEQVAIEYFGDLIDHIISSDDE